MSLNNCIYITKEDLFLKLNQNRTVSSKTIDLYTFATLFLQMISTDTSI